MFCREQAARIASITPEIIALGGLVYAIGNGSKLMAEDFAERFQIPFPLLTDPQRNTYAAAGMRRNLGLGPSSIIKAGRALAGGHRQGATQGDVWQQGGVLVIDPAKTVLLFHADRSAGDHLPLAPITQVFKDYRRQQNAGN